MFIVISINIDHIIIYTFVVIILSYSTIIIHWLVFLYIYYLYCLYTICVLFFFVLASVAQGLWEQRATNPPVYEYSVSFSINSMGYVLVDNAVNNFYRYDPVANTWTAKADFPGGKRSGAAGFATDSFGYVGGGGNDSVQRLNDFYRYEDRKSVV